MEPVIFSAGGRARRRSADAVELAVEPALVILDLDDQDVAVQAVGAKLIGVGVDGVERAFDLMVENLFFLSTR